MSHNPKGDIVSYDTLSGGIAGPRTGFLHGRHRVLGYNVQPDNCSGHSPVTPATGLDMCTGQPGPSLLAANGSPIKTIIFFLDFISKTYH